MRALAFTLGFGESRGFGTFFCLHTGSLGSLRALGSASLWEGKPKPSIYIGPAARRLIHESEPVLTLRPIGVFVCAMASMKKWSLRAREQLRCFEVLGRTPWLPLPWLPLKGRKKGGWRIEHRQHETLQQESCSRRKWPFYSEQQG